MKFLNDFSFKEQFSIIYNEFVKHHAELVNRHNPTSEFYETLRAEKNNYASMGISFTLEFLKKKQEEEGKREQKEKTNDADN